MLAGFVEQASGLAASACDHFCETSKLEFLEYGPPLRNSEAYLSHPNVTLISIFQTNKLLIVLLFHFPLSFTFKEKLC